jgi:ribosomal protein S18 acetylase RimI-like enzyme
MATGATVLVRAARGGDPAAIGAIQARAWRTAYGDLLPADRLAALTPEALEPAWRRAVTEPPSRRHAVLVAVTDDILVGFAAVGPSGDRDAGEADGQLAVLAVDPAHQRAGHGSRLLSAVVDHLREHGLSTLSVWVPESDTALLAFFTSAGMVADGARRELAAADGAEGAEGAEGVEAATVTELRLSAEVGEPATTAGPAPGAG